jgi:putative spermidine/putrescine transport system permease protein
MAEILRVSVTEPKFGLQNYAELIASAPLRRIFSTTFRVSAETTAISLLLGYTVAYVLAHSTPRAAKLMMIFVLLPFWISALVRAFAWVVFLRSHGLVNSALLALGVVDSPLDLIFNETGVLIGMVHYMIPLAAMSIYAQMSGLDGRLMIAARGLGAGPLEAFLRIYFPLTTPGIVAAGMLIFISALGFFITPAILGGGKSLMIAEYISFLISETLNWGLGTALAVSLLFLVFGLLVILSRLVDFKTLFGAR